jgi:hypothetical protein
MRRTTALIKQHITTGLLSVISEGVICDPKLGYSRFIQK